MKLVNNLVVREAKNEDIEGIIGVLKTADLQDEAWTKEALRKLLTTKNYTILVAELDGKIVGFIDYYVLPSVWERWNEATINYFFVHKDYQGKGIGSRLLNGVIKGTDGMEIVELHVGTEKDNNRAIDLYRKHGFVKEYLLLQREKEPFQ